MQSHGFAAKAANTPLEPFEFKRRELQAGDVHIDIYFCGVCHSDLHMARNEWGISQFPLVPVHEIVGPVLRTGSDVNAFKAGDLVGVGVMVDSCGHCGQCRKGEEQYCEAGFTATYNGEEKAIGGRTFGGYSDSIVVDSKFVVTVPENLPLNAVAPLLCAGVTTWSPLKH
ncbi:alcohol dehydrogenase [Erwinia amylovora Ea644]|nr:alcohol dehydrogenase [Erwinia amylovora Ea644]CCP09000.1 alcohol dehydrogenase [Erwinia amylovora MR1]